MTDHESEQFYHDLRQKLQGYGSAPPETVWRGIREQVPVRKRRLRPVLWLLLVGTLLTGALVGTRQWGSAVFGPTTTGTASVAPPGESARAAAGPAGSSSNQLGRQPGTTETAAEPLTAAAARTPSGTGTAPGASSLDRSEPGIGAANGATTGRAAGLPDKPLLLASTDTRGKRTGRPGTENNAEETVATIQPAAEAAASVSTGAATATSSATSRRSTRRRSRHSTRLLAAAGTRHALLDQASHSASRRAVAGLTRTTPGSRSGAAAGQPDVTKPSLLNADTETGGLASTESAATTRRNRARQAKISNEPLALLVVRPAVAETPEPEVDPVKRTARRRPTRQEIRLRNWSAQLLLGSGLTYRALGGSPTQLERLERPDLGFSGQASATYALSRQLALSVGLGYSEYASSLNYQLRKTTADSVGHTLVRKQFRDVYRFLTIPVQAQLTLAGNPRWRYGVQGGGTVALLADAQTTEGSACNCQQVQWNNSARTMPFNRTNVILTGGAFASYQFALGQWFTIRPQGQIFLNSLSTAASGRAQRRPWSLGLQAGYSWDLDPRKH